MLVHKGPSVSILLIDEIRPSVKMILFVKQIIKVGGHSLCFQLYFIIDPLLN